MQKLTKLVKLDVSSLWSICLNTIWKTKWVSFDHFFSNIVNLLDIRSWIFYWLPNYSKWVLIKNRSTFFQSKYIRKHYSLRNQGLLLLIWIILIIWKIKIFSKMEKRHFVTYFFQYFAKVNQNFSKKETSPFFSNHFTILCYRL